MTKSDDRLRNQIITACVKEVKAGEVDIIIDKFVKKYDESEWCRGWFKHQIYLLVKEALKRGELNGTRR